MLIYSSVQFVQWESTCPFIEVMFCWIGVIKKWMGDHPCHPLSLCLDESVWCLITSHLNKYTWQCFRVSSLFPGAMVASLIKIISCKNTLNRRRHVLQEEEEEEVEE